MLNLNFVQAGKIVLIKGTLVFDRDGNAFWADWTPPSGVYLGMGDEPEPEPET